MPRFLPTIALMLTFVLGLPAYADEDWGQLSSKLAPRMTEQQLMQAVGYRPNKVEVQTCGGNTKDGAWMCKIYTFGYPASHLTVRFYEDGVNKWYVNSWDVYP
jgi:hypothetical protein